MSFTQHQLTKSSEVFSLWGSMLHPYLWGWSLDNNARAVIYLCIRASAHLLCFPLRFRSWATSYEKIFQQDHRMRISTTRGQYQQAGLTLVLVYWFPPLGIINAVSAAGYYQRYVSSTCVNGETVRQDSKSSTAPSSTTCGYHQQEVITLVLDWRFPPLGFINATWYQRALIGRPFDKIHKDSTAPNLTKIIKWSTMVCVWSTTVDIVSLVILWRWHDECDIICSTLLLYPGIFSLVLFELLENSFWCRGQLLLGFLASPRAIFTVGDKQGLYFTATAYSRFPLNVLWVYQIDIIDKK